MVTFSCWTFNENHSLDDIAQEISSNTQKYISTDCSLTISTINGFDISTPNSINVLDKDINFLFFTLCVNYSNQSQNQDMDVLIYEFEGSIKINAFRGQKTAHKYLKLYFCDDFLGKPIDDKPEISEDLLYWIFKSFIDTPRSPLYHSNCLYIKSLKRYRGVTKDQNNTLMGEGDRISDILGTLAFLLDNDDLKMLRPKITYTDQNSNHTLLIDVRLTGTLKFDMSHYSGNFVFDDNLNKLKIILSIFYSRIILPIIVSSYKKARIDDIWSPILKRDFIIRIGDKIKTRVDIELQKLNNEIENEKEKEIAFNNSFATYPNPSDDYDLDYDDVDDLDE